ncbi:DNA-3-methyladenine glycosylase I [uncultured Methanobrevibacter sp.]|uniref:DNA-3-methyladenine glycosylase I n=1 Tax=uncultured Methanobrevibacter sp. TaxID=253161 RepID=UPI0025E87F50|nr:DNA-3-methyladenine glycosylase I [uncultured Methanobrevibacter sp.]
MSVNDGKKRCSWCNLDNGLYVKYHDEEWGVLNFDERYLFEMLVLESFQAGLSWETVLNKREAFRQAYDNFDIDKVVSYNDKKVEELENNQDIIRNKLKISASINNGKVFKEIQKEFGSFHNYLKTFIPDEVIYENNKTSSPLSEDLSHDLKKRGMKFIGPTIIYSYLQAIGVINSHDDDCFMYIKNK